MIDFIVGNTYKDEMEHKDWICLSVEKEFVSFKFNKIVKRFKKIIHCGVNTALIGFNNRILAESIKPIYDEEIDGIQVEKIYDFNKNGETYVNLFKEHKKD